MKNGFFFSKTTAILVCTFFVISNTVLPFNDNFLSSTCGVHSHADPISPVQMALIVRGPYLQSGTDTSMVIRWRTDVSTDSKVWYGDSPTNLNQSKIVSGSFTDHEVIISGLTSNTIYYYAIGDSNGQIAGANNDHYFKTSPPAGTSQPYTVWVLGDSGFFGNDDQESVRDAYYNYIGNNHTDMVLMLGDNAYSDGLDSEYQNGFFEVYPQKLRSTVFWPCPGNHDYGAENGLDADYYDVFTLPVNGEAGGLASNTEKYYSFNYGNIHIISLDSHDEDRSTNSPMLTWLENDLAANVQDWVVLIFHHPPYSKGSRDSDVFEEQIEMRENVVPICEQYGVDLILSGHSHSYERSRLIHGHYGYSSSYDPLLHNIDGGDGRIGGDGAYQQNGNEDGTVYMVSGSSGQAKAVGDHPVMYYSSSSLGSTVLEVNGGQMDIKFLNNSGVVEDYLTLNQSGTPSVHWVTPLNGDLYTGLNAITFNVNAFDSNGSITGVEFFVDGVSVGSDATAPYTLSWTPPSYDDYVLSATATDNDGNSNTSNITISVQDGSQVNIVVKVNSNDDDVEERISTGEMRFSSSDLELVDDGVTPQLVGIRFNGIDIPPAATVISAYIQFTVDELDSGTTNLTIAGEAIDQAPTFSNNNFDISNRTTTTASVNWSPPPWTNLLEAGTDQQTPNLSSVVQEIIDRPGWLANNSMVFIITGTGERTAESHNGSSADAPTLHVTYSIQPINCDPFVDADNDGSCSDVDCNDNDLTIHPNATEVCDGVDNNCDTQIDEGLTNTYYADNDSDGYGDPNNTTVACSPPAGYVTNTTDCNDSDPMIYIGAACDDGNPNTNSDAYNENCICIGSSLVSINVQINNNDDDVEERNNNGSVNFTSSDLELPWDGNNGQTVGLRFNNIDVPSGAIITDAYIQFTVDESDTKVTNITIKGEYHDNAPPFTNSNSNVSNRATTVASVTWTPPAWTVIGAAGVDQQTPNLSDIVQEIVGRAGWAANNSMVFVLSGTGERTAESHNGSSPNAPILHITYSSNSCDPFVDADNDGVCSDIDCDDSNPNINPSATEVCDGIDNNCDGQTDEGVTNTYYADADSDGHGDPDVSTLACSAPAGYVTDNTDCDDMAAAVNPSATEVCDGIDNNCDGQTDEGVTNTYYADSDSDGYGDPNVSTLACSAPAGYVIDNADCDDSNPDINPSAAEVCDGIDNNCNGQTDEGVTNTYYADSDSDNYGDPNVSTIACSAPAGYVTDNTDCDDSDAAVNPAATEVCDGIDNDCDGQTDEGLTNTYYADSDSDGYGDPNVSTIACSAPAGHVTDNTDCDDSDAAVNPAATEVCDGIDNDCDGQTDEGLTNTYYADADSDGYGNPSISVMACSAPAGHVTDNTDCDDSDAAVNPAATEVCDGVDNNCDGQTDEGFTNDPYYADTDDDGYGDPNNSITACTAPAGYVTDNTDCDDSTSSANPGATEVCDGIDNDCDGQTDEGVTNTYYADSDSDGHGDPDVSTIACTAPAGYVTDNTDCNDTTSSANPGATEVCDSIDNDCDGQTDEGVTNTYFADSDSDGYGDPDVSTAACSAPAGYVTDNTDCDDTTSSANPGATEVCDGIDNDCDGQTDEGVTNTYYADTDGDSFGDANNTISDCSPPNGYVSDDTDCDDTDATIFIGASCDDGDPNTNNDVYGSDCICAGVEGCQSITIDDWDFESGWGIWNDGGSDAQRNSSGAPYANSGTYSIRLRDNTSSSVMTTDELDLSSYDSLTIDFHYYVKSFGKSDHDFWLQLSTDGGSTYNLVEEWNYGDEFNNEESKFDTVSVYGPFTSNTLLRFRCDAANNGDQVYIDDVVITGCETPNNSLIGHNLSDNRMKNEVQANKSLESVQQSDRLLLFPNPTEKFLTVIYHSDSGNTAFVELFDPTSEQVLFQKVPTNYGKNEFQLDLGHLPAGLYLFRIVESGEQLTEKVMISR